LAVIARESEYYGCEYIDKTGKTIIASDEWTHDVGSFKNGLAVVSNSIAGGPPDMYASVTFGVIKRIAPNRPA